MIAIGRNRSWFHNREAGRVDEERGCECDHEQRCAQRRSEERVGHHLGAPQAAVRSLEILRGNDGRHEGLGRVVVEHLGRAQQQGGQKHHCVEAEVLRRCRGRIELVGAQQVALLGQYGERHEQRQHRTNPAGADHEPAAIVPVGDDTGRKGEEQPWQPLHDGNECDQEAVAGDGRREPRVRDGADAVAEVGDGARREQLCVGAAELR